MEAMVHRDSWSMGLLIIAATLAGAQAFRGSGRNAAMTFSSSTSQRRSSVEIVREIDDPTTGDRWLLERDSRNPGGPGRMVLVGHEKAVRVSSKPGNEVWAGGANASAVLPASVIHAGDRVIVEEHSALVDASLEATALGPARQGAQLRVRLSIGGRVVRAVAVTTGRATLASESGARP